NALSVLRNKPGGEKPAAIRTEMVNVMERGCGIYRLGNEMQEACAKLGELRQRFASVSLQDQAKGWNTEWLRAGELGFQLDVARSIAHSALQRRESRGAYQRFDGYEKRDDEKFLKHSLAWYEAGAEPRITYSDVVITRSPPGTRAYGAAGEQAERE